MTEPHALSDNGPLFDTAGIAAGMNAPAVAMFRKFQHGLLTQPLRHTQETAP